jgi:hypothetical protein
VSKRTKIWARVARQRLIQEFGGCCQHCKGTCELEFHVIGGEQSHHYMSTDTRVSFYRCMAGEGRLQLLCRTCHQRAHI